MDIFHFEYISRVLVTVLNLLLGFKLDRLISVWGEPLRRRRVLVRKVVKINMKCSGSKVWETEKHFITLSTLPFLQVATAFLSKRFFIQLRIVITMLGRKVKLYRGYFLSRATKERGLLWDRGWAYFANPSRVVVFLTAFFFFSFARATGRRANVRTALLYVIK